MNAVRSKRAITNGKDSDDFFSQVLLAWLKDIREVLTADKAKRFREVFDKGVNEREFSLRGLRLGVNASLAIGQSLARPPLLRLDLAENLIRDAGVEAIASLVHDCTDLAYLNLGGNDIGPTGVLHLAPVIQNHKKLQTLVLGSEEGDMHANRIDSVSGKVLVEAIRASRSLTCVDLNRNPLGLTDQEPFKEFASVVEKHPHLNTIRLGETGMSTESAVAIVTKLAKNAVIQELDLQGNDLNHHAAEAFAKVFQERCSRGQHTPLQQILLQDNPRLGERGTSPLFNSIAFPKSCVTVLNVSNTGVNDDAVLCLANSLKTNNIQSLNLSKNYITELGCMALAQQLENRHTVTYLSLSNNKVRCEGAVSLAAMLETNRSITTLEIDDARIGDQGCIALGVALTNNTTLKHLKLSCNHMSDEAGRAFSSLLDKNKSIQSVGIKGNQVDHATTIKLKRLLKRNKEIRNNEVPSKLHKEVVRLHYQQCKLQEAHNELLYHKKARLKLQEEMDRHDSGLSQEREETEKKSHELLEKLRREEQEIEDCEHKMQTKGRDFAKFEADLKVDVDRLNDRLEEESRRREEAEKKLAEKRAELERVSRERSLEKNQIDSEISKVRSDTEKYQQQSVTMSEKLRILHDQLAKLEQHDSDMVNKEVENRASIENSKEAKREKARQKKEAEKDANALLFES